MRNRTVLASLLILTLVVPGCHRGGSPQASPTGPTLDNARLTGKYLMTLRVVKQSGLLVPISGGNAIWTFTPRCAAPAACRVRWTVPQNGSKGNLKRTGVYYSGTISTPANIRNCKGAANREKVVVRIRVTGATDASGDVVATRIAGTMTERNVSRGCKTSVASWGVTGVSQAG